MDMVRSLAVTVLLLAGCDGVFDLERIDVRDAGEPSPDAQIDSGGGATLTNGLYARFPFDTAAAGLVEDVVGSLDATCAVMGGNCPGSTVDSTHNALLFDGAADIVRTPSSAVLDAGSSFTISIWARIDRLPPMGDFACIIN
jgi:hypothetical protein